MPGRPKQTKTTARLVASPTARAAVVRLGPTLGSRKAPAIPPTHGFYDECLRGEVQFSLRFMKPSPFFPFCSQESFGSPGAGGALGFADPTAGIGYAYVTNKMGTTLSGDPRDVALRAAVYAAIQ